MITVATEPVSKAETTAAMIAALRAMMRDYEIKN